MAPIMVTLEPCGKSEIIHVGMVDTVEYLAFCRYAKWSLYLGLPLRESFKSKAVWNGIEERFQKISPR